MEQKYIDAINVLINIKKPYGHKTVQRGELNIAIAMAINDVPNGRLVTKCIHEVAKQRNTQYVTNGKKSKLFI